MEHRCGQRASVNLVVRLTGWADASAGEFPILYAGRPRISPRAEDPLARLAT